MSNKQKRLETHVYSSKPDVEGDKRKRITYVFEGMRNNYEHPYCSLTPLKTWQKQQAREFPKAQSHDPGGSRWNVFTNSATQAGGNTRSILKQISTDLNLEFSFS